MNFSLSQWFKGKRTDVQPDSRPATATATASAAPAAVAIKQAPLPPRTTARVPVRTGVATTHSATPNPLRAPSARPAPSLPVGPVRSTTRVGRVPTSLPPRLRKSPFAGGIALVHAMPEKARELSQPEPLPPGPDLPVVLELGDFLDRIPASLLQTGAPDRNRRVEFRSSELFSDLARGRASVAASVIYQKCPEVFSRAVGEGEDAEVALPLQKLVEQLAPALRTRPDQAPAEAAGEIDTPFRQAAIEDNARLPRAEGTTAGPIPAPVSIAPVTAAPPKPVEIPFARPAPRQISAIPAMKAAGELPSPLAPPTAQSAGSISALKRPPSTVRASVAGGKIRLSGPAAVNRGYSLGRVGEEGETARVVPPDPGQPSVSLQVSKKTARIHLPPISLRVTGNNARLPSPAAPKAHAPQPIPPAPSMPAFRPAPTLDRGGAATFRSTPPAPRPSRPSSSPFATARPSFPPPAFPSAPPADAAAKPASPALPPPDSREIHLRLAAVLRGIPPSLLAAEASSIPEDLEFSLPFRLIEPQLSSGRVSIARHVFVRALPESHREILGNGDEPADIPLPLEEVFRRLPSNVLALRPDQTVQETGEAFPTPFKQKADEDALRFGNLQPAPEPPAAEPSWDEAAKETVLIPPLEEILGKKEPAPTEPVAEEALALPAIPDSPAQANGEHPVASVTSPAEVETPQLALPPLLLPPEPIEAPKPAAIVAPIALAPIAEPEAAPPETAPAQEPAPAPTPAPEPIRISIGEFAPHVESDAALQAILMSDEDMDAKTVVRLVSKLPGITGCTVMFGDGFRLAGNFPEEGQAEGFSAMAPVFYKRAATFADEVHFGALQALTLYDASGLLSFFMHGDICLSVKHSGRGFLPGVREKLHGVTREMAAKYAAAHPAPTPH
jgi:predicted regulator of Ras-like GTPase activity (Roadblock/LC7/MglB family)